MGNDGIEVSQTTDGSSVSIDTAIPELSSYALSVNGSSSYTAKPGDTLKVEFTTNETITSPTIKLAGHEVTASGSGTSWSAEQVLSSSDTEGLVEVELTLTDLTGNSRTLRYPETLIFWHPTPSMEMPMMKALKIIMDRLTEQFCQKIDSANKIRHMSLMESSDYIELPMLYQLVSTN